MIMAARNLTLFKRPGHGINLTRFRGIILIILTAISLATNLSAQKDNIRFEHLRKQERDR